MALGNYNSKSIHKEKMAAIGIIELNCPRCGSGFAFRLNQMKLEIPFGEIYYQVLEHYCSNCKFRMEINRLN